MTERYLLDHPRDLQGYTIWMQASGRVEEFAVRERLGLNPSDALADLGDPSDLDDPSDPGFAQRLSEGFRILEADPRAKARFRARTEFAAEIMRRRGMPPWEAERLRRAEADE